MEMNFDFKTRGWELLTDSCCKDETCNVGVKGPQAHKEAIWASLKNTKETMGSSQNF